MPDQTPPTKWPTTDAVAPQGTADGTKVPDVLQSSDLLGSRQAIEIQHNGQRYRLQSTKAGKLILTK